jgi:hypothetical protein
MLLAPWSPAAFLEFLIGGSAFGHRFRELGPAPVPVAFRTLVAVVIAAPVGIAGDLLAELAAQLDLGQRIR